MMRRVIVVLPDPVPPQIPMTSGRWLGESIAASLCRLKLSNRSPSPRPKAGRRAPSCPGHLFFLLFFCSITACAAANLAIGTRNGDALT